MTKLVPNLHELIYLLEPASDAALVSSALSRTRRKLRVMHVGTWSTVGIQFKLRGDPLYRARRALHTGADLFTEKQQTRLHTLFAVEEHIEIEATWGIYQRIVAAYREPNKTRGKQMMQAVIGSVTSGVPTALIEISRLGRTLKQRTAGVLAFFDRPGTSNGPTEAISGRLEHLRGSALGFRILTNYVARSLLESGGFRTHLHPQLR